MTAPRKAFVIGGLCAIFGMQAVFFILPMRPDGTCITPRRELPSR
ncbi:MAG: hypothetical protein NT005_03325 [Spirochaetes bacterium]|nr:hypothetical protein [Spirochaetota bacterium]